MSPSCRAEPPGVAQYCGTFHVSLDDLVPAPELSSLRPLDPDRVNALAEIFTSDLGCDHGSPEHQLEGWVTLSDRIPSIQSLRAENDATVLSSGQMRPMWEWGPVQYLKGQHRLEAARRACARAQLEGHWTVAVYARAICPTPSGLMIREILDAHRAGDDHTIEAWSARLGQNQRKNVQRLLSLGQEVTEALYALTPFVGLWEAFEIGRIPALQKLHCPQELACGLNHIRNVWADILRKAACPPHHLDATTLSLLEGLCPARSTHDATRAERHFDTKAAFRFVKLDAQRLILWRCIMQVPFLLPSLFSFLENTKLLSVGAASISRLLLRSTSKSRQQAMVTRLYLLFRPRADVSHGTGATQHRKEEFRDAYLRLWLHALYYFPELQDTFPRTDRPGRMGQGRELSEASHALGTTRTCTESHELWQWELASTASDLGFDGIFQSDRGTMYIENLSQFLIRTPLAHKIEAATITAAVHQLYRSLDKAMPVPDPVMEAPHMVTDDSSNQVGDGIRYRCGRPYTTVFAHVRHGLTYGLIFNPELSSPSIGSRPGQYLTPFFCLRDVLNTFFMPRTASGSDGL